MEEKEQKLVEAQGKEGRMSVHQLSIKFKLAGQNHLIFFGKLCWL